MLSLIQAISDPLNKVLNIGGRLMDKKREAALAMLENTENDPEVAKKAKDT